MPARSTPARSRRSCAAANEAGYTIVWTLETHAHADHLSGSPYIKAKTGAKIGIGEHIKDVQRIFRPVFNATDLKTDGSDFDHLFKDGERFKIGELEAEVHLYARAHAGRHHLQDRRRRLRRRHAVHARLRHGARRFSRAATRTSSIARSAGCWRCRRRRGCSCATTTRRPAATAMPGRRRSPRSARRMCTSRTA